MPRIPLFMALDQELSIELKGISTLCRVLDSITEEKYSSQAIVVKPFPLHFFVVLFPCILVVWSLILDWNQVNYSENEHLLDLLSTNKFFDIHWPVTV